MRTKRRGLLLIILPVLFGLLEARPKTDVIILENDDRITGEIKKLERGILKVKTDWMGTLQVEWEHVKKIESEYFYEVELSSGKKYFGSIQPAETPKSLEVTSAYITQKMDQISIVNITPIRKTFLDRLDFAVDSGFNYTQANRSGELQLTTSAKYRVEKYSAQADYSTLFKKQRDVDTTRRNQLGLNFTRYLQNRWFLSALANFLQSDELALDLRSVFGGGAGKNLIQANRLVFSLLGGAVINREEFVDEAVKTSAEGLSGIQFQTFKFDKPEMDISSTFLFIPSFSDSGRFRLDLDTKVRIEIIKDLFWQLSLFDNYDSRPPEGNEKNDFGIYTGVGWSF